MTFDESTWASLPADVLNILAPQLSNADLQSVLQVCKGWSLDIKSRLHKLQPFHLEPGESPGAFPALQVLSAPLHRVRRHGYVEYEAPLHAPMFGRPAYVAQMARFPTLTSLNLSGQTFDGDACSLKWICLNLGSLTSLDVSRCSFVASHLAGISSLTRLKSLNLSCVQLTVDGDCDPAAKPNCVAHLSWATTLTSLNVSLPTDLTETPGYPEEWQPSPTRLELAGSVHFLQPLTGIQSLTALNQPLSSDDVASMASSLPQLQTLRISWLHPTNLPSSPLPAWHAMTNLVSLTELSLDLHGSPSVLGISISSLSNLRQLRLVGCSCFATLLSVAELRHLTRLTIEGLPEPGSREPILHILSSLPQLKTVELINPIPSVIPAVEHLGDAVFRHMLRANSALTELNLNGLMLYGTGLNGLRLRGFGPGSCLPPAPGPFPLLRRLKLNVSLLMRSKTLSLSHLSALEELTLTGVRYEEFSECCRLGCFDSLASLTRLTQLRTLRSCSEPVRRLPRHAREPHLHFLAHMTSLRVLHLGALDSWGCVFVPIASLTSLRVLALEGRIRFTAGGAAALAACRLPALRSLRLVGVSPLGVASSAAGAAASAADGAAAATGDAGAASSAAVPMLPPTDDEVVHLLCAAFTGLRHLELGSCEGVSEGGLAVLRGLPRLKYLRCHDLALKASVPRRVFGAAGGHRLLYMQALPQGYSRTRSFSYTLVRRHSGMEIV